MAQWSIQGADRKSGRGASLLVEAPSPELARQVAKDRGLVVSSVRPAHSDGPGTPVEDISAPPVSAVLNYLQKTRPAATPTLRAILWTYRAWHALAIAAYVLGAATLAFGAMSLPRHLTSYGVLAVLRDTLYYLIVGAIFQLVSTLLLVLRDRLAPREPDPA